MFFGINMHVYIYIYFQFSLISAWKKQLYYRTYHIEIACKIPINMHVWWMDECIIAIGKSLIGPYINWELYVCTLHDSACKYMHVYKTKVIQCIYIHVLMSKYVYTYMCMHICIVHIILPLYSVCNAITEKNAWYMQYAWML